MAEMFPSVSCLVSPRKGEAPLSLEQNIKIAVYHPVWGELQYNVEHTVSDIMLFEVHLQDVGDDPNAPHVCF